MKNAGFDPGQFKTRLSQLTIVPVALALLVAIGLFAQIQYLVVVSERLAQPERVIAQANAVRTNMLDAETGVRGYVLTGDELYLEPYVSSRRAVAAAFDSLRTQVADHPEQLTRVDSIQQLQEEWFRLVEPDILLRRAGRDVVPSMRPRPGKQIVDEMRHELDAFMRIEEQRRELRFAESQRATSFAMWLMGALALVLGVATGFAARRQFVALTSTFGDALGASERNVHALQESEERYRLLVDERDEAIRQQDERLEVGVRERTADVEASNRLLEIESARHLAARLEIQRYADEVRDLYDNAPCGYHSLDASGVIVHINDTELKWLDLTRDEVVGKLNFREILTPASQVTFDESFPRLMSSGRVDGLEFEVLRSDRSPMFVLVSATASYDEQGKYRSSRSTLIDITRRSNVEIEAARARERYAALIRASSLAVYTLDSNGVGTDADVAAAWEAITGLPNDPANLTWWVDTIHPDDRERIRSEFKNAIAMRAPYEMELRAKTVTGAYRVFLSKAVPILEQDGTFREWVGTLSDVTARAEAERTVRELNERLAGQVEELHSANSELDSFAYSVSHDLRAPLRAIDGFSRILSEDCGGALSPDCLEHIVVIRENTVYMGRLIDDLLAFSRLGRAAVSVEVIDTRALVQHVLDSMKPDTDTQRATLVVGDLAPCTADPSLLKQVFQNLIANALKYSGKRDDAVIEIGSVAASEPGNETVFFVRDNGVGFDMLYAHKLYGVFQRLHRSEDYEGTGVGLAIVHRIVAKHGGRVWAEGAVNAGATFSFSIPAEVPA